MNDTPNTPEKKSCSKCGQVKSATLEFFARDRRNKSGLTSACKVCCQESRRRYYAENGEKVRESNRQWREENREMHRASQRKWREENGEKHRESDRRRRKANPEKAKERNRKWREANPEKARASDHRRRVRRLTRKLAASGSFTGSDAKLQYKSQKGKCWWCSCEVGSDYHVDHLVPLAKGGSNGARNIVIACPQCNLSKGAKLPHEFIKRLL